MKVKGGNYEHGENANKKKYKAKIREQVPIPTKYEIEIEKRRKERMNRPRPSDGYNSSYLYNDIAGAITSLEVLKRKLKKGGNNEK